MIQRKNSKKTAGTGDHSKNGTNLKIQMSRNNLIKKFRFIILCGLLCAVLNTIYAQSGTIGSLSWNITGKTLTITGTGAMPNYDDDSVPWYTYRTSISNIVIGKGVSSIGDCAFYDCSSLASIIIPNSVTKIGVLAFYRCSSLTSITIPNSVTYIGILAFSNCSGLASINISNSITCINEGIFSGCSSLTSVTIPNSIITIEKEAFYNCSGLTTVTIPNAVKSIGDGAFSDCSGLKSVIISNSVIIIGDDAFSWCRKLTEITNHATTPQTIDTDVFLFVDETICTLRVPATSIAAYRTAAGWKGFKNIEAIK